MTVTSSEAISVSALNRRVREQLEGGFPLCWVAGEISNLTQAASGHVYFSLKDAGAQVRCTLWRGKAQLLGWRLENGQKVEARVLVTLYEPRGEFQLNVEAVRRAGQGDLHQRFLQLKAKLEAEGLFDPALRRPLPVFPRRIGIVTSPQAAALRDVLTTFRRRAPHVSLTLYPAPVQGEGAGERIASALAVAAGDGNDLVLLCRGGGSIEDLWAFNEEVVARAIRATAVPVVCGVGHETDFTIADFAADLRAPTPTAAAELAAPDRNALFERLDELGRHLAVRARRKLMDTSQQLDWLGCRLTHPAERIARKREDLSRLETRMFGAAMRRLDLQRHRLHLGEQRLSAAKPRTSGQQQKLNALALRLAHAGEKAVAGSSARLHSAAASLRQLDPHAVLKRGYALARDKNGKIVRHAAQLLPGDAIQLAFGQGNARATVDDIAPAEENQ